MNKRKLGEKYEQLVKVRLEKANVNIIESNYRNRLGEIDLIARDDIYYVFVEVKFRSSDVYGLPEEAVGYKKQKTICKLAKKYMYDKGLYLDTPVRFDVIVIINDKIKWYKNAFDFI